jgi:hypothetical protein
MKTLSNILDDAVEATGFAVGDHPFSVRFNPENFDGAPDDMEDFVLQTERCGNVKMIVDTEIELLAIDFDNDE